METFILITWSCAVNQQLRRPDIFLLLQYLLPRPSIQTHIGHNISQPFSEMRNLDSYVAAPPAQGHALEAGEGYFWGIMRYELQNQLIQQINKENTE